MRKKELMKRLSDLVTTVEKLNRRVKELEAENRELESKVAGLEAEKSVLVKEAEVLPARENAVYSAPSKPQIKTSEGAGFTVRIVDEVELNGEGAEAEELNIMEYGAVIIGKITVESAKCCDTVTKNGGNDVKELLSLIMGKSELSKAEILNIAMSDAEDSVKREMIDAELTGAVEYFKSVSEQNK